LKYNDNIKVLALFSSVVLLVANCTGPVNEDTTKDMPTGYLCRILNSKEYISLPSEQKAIYSELERRGENCKDFK